MKKNLFKVVTALFLTIAALGCSHEIELKTLDAPKVVAKAYPGVNYVSWTPVANAQGYKLYRYDTTAEEGAVFIDWFECDDLNGYHDTLGYADYVYEGNSTTPSNLLKDGVEYKYYVIASSGRWSNQADAATGAGSYVATDALISDSTGSATVKANIPPIYSLVDVPENVTIGYEGNLLVARFDSKPYLEYDVLLTVPGTEEIVQAIVKNNLEWFGEEGFASAAKFTPVAGEYQVSIKASFGTNYYQPNYKTYPEAKIKVNAISSLYDNITYYSESSGTYSPNTDRGLLEVRSSVVEGNTIKYLFRFGRFDDLIDSYEGVNNFEYHLFKTVGTKELEEITPELTTGYSGKINYSYFYETYDISVNQPIYYYLLIKDENNNILPVYEEYINPARDANSVVINNFTASKVALDDDSEENDVRITWNTTDPAVNWSLKFGNEDDIATIFNDTANVIDVSDIQPYYVDTTPTGGTTPVRTFYYTKLVRNFAESENNYVFILSGSKEGKNSTQKTTTTTFAKAGFKPVVDLMVTKQDQDVVISWGPADLDTKRNFKYTLYRAAYTNAGTGVTPDKEITTEYTLVASTDAALVGEVNALKADVFGNYIVKDENLPDADYIYLILAEGAAGLYPAGQNTVNVTGNTITPTTLSTLSINDVVIDGKLERTLSWTKLPEDSIYDVYTIYRAKANITFPTGGGTPTLNGLLSQYEKIACSADENTAIEEEYSVNNVTTTNWNTTKITYDTTMSFVDETASAVYDYVYYVVATSTGMPTATPDEISNSAKNSRLAGNASLSTPLCNMNSKNQFNISWAAPTTTDNLYYPVEYKLYYQPYSDSNRKDLKDNAWKEIAVPAPVNGKYYVVADLNQYMGKYIAFNLTCSNCYDNTRSYRWIYTTAPFSATAPSPDAINGYAIEIGELTDADSTKVIAITLYGKGFDSSYIVLNVAESNSSGSRFYEQYYTVSLTELKNRKLSDYPTVADDGDANGEQFVTYYWPIDKKYLVEGSDESYLSYQFTIYGYTGNNQIAESVGDTIDANIDTGTFTSIEVE